MVPLGYRVANVALAQQVEPPRQLLDLKQRKVVGLVIDPSTQPGPVPIVEILGPTLAERSEPWRPQTLKTESIHVTGLPCRPCEQRECVPGDFRCLTGIAATDVLAAAERVLEAG